ncbi:hypothetical protein KP509_36G006400 [Ceratopteris richardii]|uniref:Uncharacterized protein n=1 Tax=Ceratopteris richardii TaxID=49495 RepID=A0A8T2QAT0_CERRI|nr:hypothetical protein KP509_36G006400 [Ceratopteris richardii]
MNMSMSYAYFCSYSVQGKPWNRWSADDVHQKIKKKLLVQGKQWHLNGPLLCLLDDGDVLLPRAQQRTSRTIGSLLKDTMAAKCATCYPSP